MSRSAFEEIEARYRRCMREPLSRAAQMAQADIVVGIPFYDEEGTLPEVIRTAARGLRKYYPDSRCVIVAAGSPVGERALVAAETMSPPPDVERIAFIIPDELLKGKGWGIRAILDIADKLHADVVLLEADLTPSSDDCGGQGLSPEWIRLLLEPIRSGRMDMVISRFACSYTDNPVSIHIAYPLLTALYDRPIHCLLGGQWGITHRLLRLYLNNPRYAWETEISGYGVDGWLATAAITSGARICEANLGIKIHRRSADKEELVFRQLLKSLFDRIVNDSEWWLKTFASGELPMVTPLPTVGIGDVCRFDIEETASRPLIRKYRDGWNDFRPLYEKVFPEEIYRALDDMSRAGEAAFHFPDGLWARVVYEILLTYAFSKEFDRGDVLNSFVPLHNAFMASRVASVESWRKKLVPSLDGEAKEMIAIRVEKDIDILVDTFLRQRPEFQTRWLSLAETLKPLVPPVTYREFIPGVPLIVPTEIQSPDGDVVTANSIYENVFESHKKEFEHFIHDLLGVPREAGSLEMSLSVKDFLHAVESRILPVRNLSTIKGTRETVQAIFDDFPHGDTFSLTQGAAAWLLSSYPPLTLITRLGYANLVELLGVYDPCDALAMASWTEEREYIDGLWELMIKELRPDYFELSPIKFLVLKHDDFPALAELRGASALDRLTGRIVVSSLHKGVGGEFPRIRYFTTVARDMVEAERFGRIWQGFALDKKDFGRKVVNSMRGHWGRYPLSAHNIFEDGNQRILVERIRQMVSKLENESPPDETRRELAGYLRDLADSYFLSLILPDGKFVTCSAWSWASYSFNGGRSSPSPLSVHVERDWASREFLLQYYRALGGTEERVEETIIELMGQGREWEDLALILLGTEEDAGQLMPGRMGIRVHPQTPAGEMVRYRDNPVLRPVKGHDWESRYVLNSGVIRLEGRVYMMYRAYGEDEVSRFGLAVSEDGFNFDERLDRPVFEPRGKVDRKGCEDPRLTLIGDRVYMAYIVFDGKVAQIALASIGVQEFLDYRWKGWRRHGQVFPGFTDKDAALFPEQFDGEYAMLHRVDPHIWLTFSSHLRCPWSRKKHRILAGATSGMMWDGHKIGAGAQPIKTRYGWLLITHGVDYSRVYRLGVMVLDIDNPSRLIYRSPNFVLEPAGEWEIGEKGKVWTSNVVFTCGALPRDAGKPVLDADDELIIYYGAADSVICAATARVGTLIPEEVRDGKA